MLVAGGSGSRLAAGVPKAFAALGGRPLLQHALQRILASRLLGHVVVVVPAAYLDHARALVDPAHRSRVDIVAGGASRPSSVRAGLSALRPADAVVLVHDAARALAPTWLVDAVVEAVRSGHPAVVPGMAMTDTVKQVDHDGRVLATPLRDSLRGIQTPQGFRRDVLERAHADARSDVTDDAGLVERMGIPVVVVAGDAWAMKVTTAVDLQVAEVLLRNAEAGSGSLHA